MRVGIVFGGPSVEHDISIITASQILASINRKKYKIVPIYYSKDKKFYEVKNFDSLKNWTGDIKLLQEIPINRLQGQKKGNFSKIKYVDCVVCAFHGKNTEGGELAGLFEVLDIPYSSNSILGASLGQDKITMKKVLKSDEINVLKFTEISVSEYRKNDEKSIEKISKIGYPLIVKPSMLGSSIGIKKVSDENELKKALNEALKYEEMVIIEQYLTDFREFNCAIFDDLVSDIEEVEVKSNIFTFEDKYQTHKTNHILPANIDEELKNEIIDFVNGYISYEGNNYIDRGDEKTFIFIPNKGYYAKEIIIDEEITNNNIDNSLFSFVSIYLFPVACLSVVLLCVCTLNKVSLIG